MNQIDITEIFKAFSSSVRLEIFRLLLEKKMCVSKIALELNITQPSVTQHLKILQSIGLVTSKKMGYWVHYSIDRRGLKKIKGELQKFINSLVVQNKRCEKSQEKCTEVSKAS